MKFEKISKEQFIKDILPDLKFKEGLSENEIENEINKLYDKIKLPKRATMFSAGYDFYSLFDFVLCPGETIKIPSCVRIKLDNDKMLLMAPRSSLGFKYKLKLDNTIGIIDADYYNAKNEGHMWIKFTNHSDASMQIKEGEAIAQGIILPYYTVENDDTTDIRVGGIGSTNK